MIKTNQIAWWYPRYIAESVLEISTEKLTAIGVTHLVLDIDETVVPRGHNQLSEAYIDHLNTLGKAGIQLLIASNSRRDLSNIADQINAPIVVPTRWSFKPLGHYYDRVITQTGSTPSAVAMVGDRLLNDVIGANLAGLVSIMVEPVARQQLWYHRWYFRKALKKSES